MHAVVGPVGLEPTTRGSKVVGRGVGGAGSDGTLAGRAAFKWRSVSDQRGLFRVKMAARWLPLGHLTVDCGGCLRQGAGAGLLEGGRRSAHELERVLAEPMIVGDRRVRHRFARQRSSRLTGALAGLEMIDVEQGARSLRDAFTTLPGVGPKTAFWVVQNHRASGEVAVIDVHVQRTAEGAAGRPCTAERTLAPCAPTPARHGPPRVHLKIDHVPAAMGRGPGAGAPRPCRPIGRTPRSLVTWREDSPDFSLACQATLVAFAIACSVGAVDNGRVPVRRRQRRDPAQTTRPHRSPRLSGTMSGCLGC
jgi:hypothetical protein